MNGGRFLPDRVTVGMFQIEDGLAGFVTCRKPGKGWLNDSVFKRLSGYSPAYSSDAEV